MSEESRKVIGRVTHYFTGIGVAVVKLEAPLKVGDSIAIEGATTKLTQKVASMQVSGKDITEAKAGDDIGLKVDDRVRPGDTVYAAEGE